MAPPNAKALSPVCCKSPESSMEPFVKSPVISSFASMIKLPFIATLSSSFSMRRCPSPEEYKYFFLSGSISEISELSGLLDWKRRFPSTTSLPPLTLTHPSCKIKSPWMVSVWPFKSSVSSKRVKSPAAI